MSKKNKLEIKVGVLMFQFESYQHWADSAAGLYSNCGLLLEDTIAVDSRGRVVRFGSDFLRAQRLKSYPVKVYAVDPRSKPLIVAHKADL